MLDTARMGLFGSVVFTASLALAGQSEAQTCAEQLSELADLIEANAQQDVDRNAGKANDPLVVTMADGKTVDLSNDAPVARPFENWFGDPIKRKEVDGRIAKARSLAEAEADDGCMSEIIRIQDWFDKTADPSG